MIFEISHKRPNEPWASAIGATYRLDSRSCDTQGMKKSYSKLSHKKTNRKAEQ